MLGCRLAEPADDHLRRGGAVVFPEIPDVPVDPYRSTLYTADELYADLDDGLPGHARRPGLRLVAAPG